MAGSEIAIIWAMIAYWLADIVRTIRSRQLAGQGAKLFISGIRITIYAGFVIWFIVSHWN